MYSQLSGALYVVFKSNDSTNILYTTVSYDGCSWQQPATACTTVTDVGGSPAIVALDGFLDAVYPAFHEGSYRLHAAKSNNPTDSTSWKKTILNSIPMGETSPTLTSLNGLAYAAFQKGGQLHVYSSQDGGTRQATLSASAEGAPAITAINGVLYVAFRDDQGNLGMASNAGGSWEVLQGVTPVGLGGSPSLTTQNGQLILAFQGSNNHLAIYYSSDGKNWTEESLPPVPMGGPPAIAALNGNLHVVFKTPGTNPPTLSSFLVRHRSAPISFQNIVLGSDPAIASC